MSLRDLMHHRDNRTTTLRLRCAEGVLVVRWPWGVDRHELAKAGRGDEGTRWEDVLEKLSRLVDCHGTEIEVRRC